MTIDTIDMIHNRYDNIYNSKVDVILWDSCLVFSPYEGSCNVFFNSKESLTTSCILWCSFAACSMTTFSLSEAKQNSA